MSYMGQREVWLRDERVDGVPSLLQPVAHSLLQCREEVASVLVGLTPDAIWTRHGNAASMGFHVRHAAGSLDRLFTYARGEALSDAQLDSLTRESEPDEQRDADARLVAVFDAAVVRALEQLRRTSETELIEPRYVGRGRLPSTVIGLLFHAAEHTQRHVGQLVSTRRLTEPHGPGG